MATTKITTATLRRQLQQQLRSLPIDRAVPAIHLPTRIAKKSPTWPLLPIGTTLTTFDQLAATSRSALLRRLNTVLPTRLHDARAQAATPNWYVLSVPSRWRGELVLPPNLATHWPTLIVLVGVGARITLTEPRTTPGGLSIYILASAGSTVHWHSAHSATAAGQWCGAASLDSGATCQWTVLDSHHGANNTTRTITNHHLGAGARATVVGLSTTSGNARSVYDITNTHLVPRTSGDVVWRAVVGGQARATITGWVRIGAAAPQTTSFLDQRALLRAGTAVVRSIPNLVIDCADVAASHRATVGPIDRSAKWFLTSRGISPASAEKILLRGFASELVGHITNSAIAAAFQHTIAAL